MQAPGHGIAIDCPRRLHPGVDRVLMQRPVLAVPVCPGRIEDHAVGVELRVVVPAGSMLEHPRHDIGRQHFDLAIPVTDAGMPAMAQHRLLQRYTRRIVMCPFDLSTQPGVSHSPQGRDALVRAEGHVETGRTALAAGVPGELASGVPGELASGVPGELASGVPGELASGVRCEAVIQPVEVAAVDLATVD